VWVCKTFKDNPIQSVELGDVFLSDKEVLKNTKAPAIPYKLVLRDGGILEGDLYFVYWDGTENWQAAEGVDWHLQDNPIKKHDLQGYVFDPDGNPIAGATVQIRQKRETGMNGITAPDVQTDKDGYYFYDGVTWPYKVGVLWEITNDNTTYIQYIGENRYYEDQQTVNIRFDGNFPEGDYTLQGIVTGPDGKPMTDFTIRIENLPNWKAEAPQKVHQYVLEKRFTNDSGKYEISNLPSDLRTVAVYPPTKQSSFFPYKKQTIDLKENNIVNFSISSKEMVPPSGHEGQENGNIDGENKEVFPQILTTVYLVSVPVDFPGLKEIIPEDKSNTKMISPETFDAFIHAVKNNPQAKIFANPSILAKDGENAEVKIDTEETGGSVKLNVKNTIRPDGNTVRMEINFEHTFSTEKGAVAQNAQTTAVVFSNYTLAIGGNYSDKDMMLLLVKPQIIKAPSSNADTPESPQAMGGRMPGMPRMPGGMGGMRVAEPNESIRFPKNWDEINAKADNIFHGTEFDANGNSKAQDEKLQEKLNTSIDLSPLKGGVPLSEAIEYIRNSVDPQLPIVVDWDELKEKGGILPTDKVRPGSYTKAPIHDALRETLYYVSKDKSLRIRDIIRSEMYKGEPLSVEFIIENNQIFIKYNPYNLVRKTYTLRPELNYDSVGTPLKTDDLRAWIIKEIWPLIDTEQKQRRSYPNCPEISLEDGGILKVFTTENAHKEIAKKLDKLEPFDSKQIAIEARFMLVNDIFLEDIGMDHPNEHSVGEVIEGPADSIAIQAALKSKPLANWVVPYNEFQILDDLQTKYIIKATQAYRDSKTLTAPKAVVLNGESTSLQVYTDRRKDSDSRKSRIDLSKTELPFYFESESENDNKEKAIREGISLNLLPSVQKDSNEIRLKGYAVISQVLDALTEEQNNEGDEIPYMQVTSIPIHTMVGNQQTVLIVGPEMTAAEEFVEHVTATRPYNYQPRVTNKQRFLILIKPTITKKSEEASSQVIPSAAEGSF